MTTHTFQLAKGAACAFALFAAMPAFAQKNPSLERPALRRATLAFERNEGQTDPRVKYLSRGDGYALFLTPNEAVFSLRKALREKTPYGRTHLSQPDKGEKAEGAVVRMQLVGGDPKAQETAFAKLSGTSNYFIGNDQSKWRTGVESYEKVGFRDVYKGVDVVYYGNQKRLEYDFVVQPKADAKAIRLRFAGAKRVKVLANGELALDLGDGSLQWRVPVAYQISSRGERVRVPAKYTLKGTREVCFQVGAYDHSKPLVIDPELIYSTFIGGDARDGGSGIAVDSSGNAYIVGCTQSSNFPVTAGAFQTNYGGVFVTKLSADGKALRYSTFLGSNTPKSWGAGIVIDSVGNAYITGRASANFPVTIGAYQTKLKGAAAEAFVAKLSANGKSLLYSTYFGGSGGGGAIGIAIDSNGNAYIAGATSSVDLPLTAGAVQRVLAGNGDTFVAKFSPDGKSLLYSTYVGGSDYDLTHGMALDSSGNVYVTGTTLSKDFPTTPGALQTTLTAEFNAFVYKLNIPSASLIYSTYWGGSKRSNGNAIAADSAGNAFVTGDTLSQDFLTTPGAYQTVCQIADGFVTKFSPDGKSLVYSTLLNGGGGGSTGYGITVDSAGHAFVVGGAWWYMINSTQYNDFPTTLGAFQPTFSGGGPLFGDAFAVKLSVDGSSLLNSTFIDHAGNSVVAGSEVSMGIATDSAMSAYITGGAEDGFTTSASAFQTKSVFKNGDAFITKLLMQDVAGKTDSTLVVRPTTVDIVPSAKLFARLARKADNAAIATRPIAFSLDGVALGTAYTIQGDGWAAFTFDYSGFSVGKHTIRIDFAGDGNDKPCVLKTTLTIVKAKTSLALLSATGRFGDTVNLTANLTRTSDKASVAGKPISFLLAGSPIGTAVTDASGTATLAYKVEDSLGIGVLTLTAGFAEDSLYLASASRSQTLNVKKAPTQVNAHNAIGKQGATITLTATLIRTTDKGTLAGKSIRFQVDSKDIGTTTTDAKGAANLIFTIPTALSVGKHPMTVIFDGDTFYVAYTSTGPSLTVN